MSLACRRIIEKNFEFIDNKAKCKICSRKLKSNRAFNLKIHLIKVHKMTESELSANIKIDKTEKKIKKRVIKVEVNKKQLFRSYIGLVTEDCIPFHVLDSENFKNIIDPIWGGLSDKLGKTFDSSKVNSKKILQLVSENIRNEIKSDLYQRLLSLKIDSAAQLSRDMFGISAQFIKSGQIQSRILGIVEIKDAEASLSENLGQEIRNTLDKFDLHMNQIISITMDNETNTINSGELLSQDDCDGGNGLYMAKFEMLQNTQPIKLDGGIQICPYAALTAQLCLLDVLKEPEIKSFLFNCRNLVKFIRKPGSGYLEILEAKGFTVPQLDCPTKWGSTYTMMEALKYAEDVLGNIKAVNNQSLDENFELNSSVWNFIEAYLIAVEPLQQTIIKFQEEQLHYGNFYAEWLKCQLCTNKLCDTISNILVKKICKSILGSMEARAKNLLDNERAVSCLYFDPRFNHTLTLSQRLQAITYLKKLYERMKNINCMNSQQIKAEFPSTSASAHYEIIQFSEKADEYLNEYLTRNFVPNANDDGEISVKLENFQIPFLRVDSNVLQFWRDKQYSDPELYSLSNICFAVPATQATTTGVFGTLESIVAANQNCLDQDILEDILLLKLNTENLDQAIENLPMFEEDESKSRSFFDQN